MFEKGKAYFFRLATYHVVGRVEDIQDSIIKLSDASWIADSGRLSNALQNGFESEPNSEIERTGEHYISLGALVDAMPYAHSLPTKTK